MSRERPTNSRIHGPHGALLVLQQIDFERLRDAQLETEVVLYAGNDNLLGNLTARYEGPVYASERPDADVLALPRPTYRFFVPKNLIERRIATESFVPSSTLLNYRPDDLEFVITAATPEEYQGLIAFRDHLLPKLITREYDSTSTQHTSEFWFYAHKKGSPKDHDKQHLLYIDSSGLTVHQQEVDGVRVFTEMDVQRFVDLLKQ